MAGWSSLHSSVSDALATRPRLFVLVGSSIVASLLAFGYDTFWGSQRLFRMIKSSGRTKQRRERKQCHIDVGAIFGMDVGGTLTKIVYFEAHNAKRPSTKVNSSSSLPPIEEEDTNSTTSVVPEETNNNISFTQLSKMGSERLSKLESPDHKAALEQLYTYMEAADSDESDVIRDTHLMIDSPYLGGKLHFLHFETRNMINAINFVSSTALIDHITSIGCTGGGAHKYGQEALDQLGIDVKTFDEMNSLVGGMLFALTNFRDECYTYRNVDQEVHQGEHVEKEGSNASSPSTSEKSEDDVPIAVKRWQKDSKMYTKKVVLPYPRGVSNFPFLVVNIGSGVSILKVSAAGVYERVSGTSLGGGTYWGLCRLLTNAATYKDVIDLAENGDAGKVDMLVKDIYGGDYGGSLSGSMVASSFGKLVMKESPRKDVKEEDLALALLMMITNNIGQVAYLNAQLHGCKQVFFMGNFLRHNPISCRRLAFAIDFWSGGRQEALFLNHEGYLGALGTFLHSAFGADINAVLRESSKHDPVEIQTTTTPDVIEETTQPVNSQKEKSVRRFSLKSLKEWSESFSDSVSSLPVATLRRARSSSDDYIYRGDRTST